MLIYHTVIILILSSSHIIKVIIRQGKIEKQNAILPVQFNNHNHLNPAFAINFVFVFKGAQMNNNIQTSNFFIRYIHDPL